MKLGFIPSDRGYSKMATRELNIAIIRGLSEQIGSCYEKTESKYWKSSPSEAVHVKLAVIFIAVSTTNQEIVIWRGNSF